ncbi:large ribosomal subunit protein mL52-like [Ruditapes philippinarum]|uniref:large ribosomal subunit protein mL52-like n=1 Tax=Ruditapes philippinarum TaxID=129788 RepID=UPI00295BF659|nr:large ribosomal subunit protein mL52-like [Ruditapes philippinarum]
MFQTMNKAVSSLQLCKTCLECFRGTPIRKINSQVLQHPRMTTLNTITSHRTICTTVPLQRKKKMARRYVPPIVPFTMYGDAHRLMRGACVKFDRYGPLFDKPDYTFLDGRPTPLTPEQMEQKIERREMAERVMKFTTDIIKVKKFNEEFTKKRELKKEKRKQYRLMEKS